ncbi:MAG: sigma-70 family RNA polymerase sigma factor [Tessaracoccus sp.]|nr:sigma-70 family RNA polymerase sigma factor [Tessaracoccus sp.]
MLGAEEELLARARAGDDLAFADLVSDYRSRLWSICLRIAGNRADAEDALQDALTAAWVHLGSFRGEARFGTWAYRIASNAAMAVVRRRRDMPSDQIELLDRPVGRDFVELLAERDRIADALDGLSPQFREALVLREFGDLSYEEIAAHQGVPVQTVKSRLHRARAAVTMALTQV